MKKGYGVLLGVVIAASVLLGPSTRSSNPTGQISALSKQPAVPGGNIVGEDFASALISRCDANSDPPCQGCGAYCPAGGLLGTIKEQFGAQQVPAKDLGKAEPGFHWNVPEGERSGIRFVIATLPDPVHTHMSLFFDRSIDAIIKAAQAHGYYFSRASMPWNAAEIPVSNDLRISKAQEVYQKQREQFPGLLIFRNSRDQGPKMLFVLVVGETPTGGIRKGQFHNALRILHDIRADTANSPDANALLILGTTFSGSLSSLRGILENDPLARYEKKIVVRSGTTTSWSATSQFFEFLRQCRPASGELPFLAFHESDDFGLERFYEYIEKNGYRRRDVAILSEGETVYGGEVGKKEIPRSGPKPNAAAQTSAAEVATSCQASPEKPTNENPEDNQVLHLTFPREISQVRAAYQRDVQTQAASEAAKQAPRTTLPLNLDVTGNDDDSVLPYARLQSPLSQESVLLNIVSNLKKNRTKYIIVLASDPLDTLFLCEFLRTGYSEGRLVTLSADLLFQRELDTSRLRGVLAITSYPLLPGIGGLLVGSAREPSQPPHVEEIFPDSYSAGVFNAFTSLVSASAEDPAALPKPPDAHYVEYGWPELIARQEKPLEWRPSLWLVTLGRDGFWPVALLDENPQKTYTYGPPTNLVAAGEGEPAPVDNPEAANSEQEKAKHNNPKPAVAWQVVWCCSFALVCGFSWLMAYPPKRPRSEALVSFIPSRDCARNTQLLLCAVLLLVLQVLFVFPATVSGNTTRSGPPFWAPPVVAILLLVAAGFRGFQLRKSKRIAWSFAGGVAAACVFLIVVHRMTASGVASGQAVFFAFRYVHLGSGVSPFLPMLFLVLSALWCFWFTMAGTYLLSGRGPILPRLATIDPGRSMKATVRLRLELLTRERNKALLEVLRPLRWDWRVHAPAISAAAAALYILGGERAVNALEGRGYELVFAALFFLGVMLLLILTFRVVAIWNEFHVLLRALENLPLRRSFDLLKGFAWRPLWKLAGSTGMMNFYRLITREMEVLRQLRNLEPGDARLLSRIAAFESQVDTLSDFYRRKPGTEEQTRAQLEKGIKILHKRLADATAAALAYLEARWSEEGYDPNGSVTEHEEQGLAAPNIPKRTACAERFVCLYFLNFILVVLRRIQTLLLSIGGAFVFILLSLNFYPFEPHLTLRTLVLVLFFLILTAVGFVYAQMHKDAVLSRITDTRPGELGVNFYLRMGGFVLVPLLSLLAAQFPEINGFLFSWLEPALQALK